MWSRSGTIFSECAWSAFEALESLLRSRRDSKKIEYVTHKLLQASESSVFSRQQISKERRISEEP